MPSLELEIFKKLQAADLFRTYPTFIETGTLAGETTFSIEPLFDYVHTIEIKEEFYDYVKNNYRGNKITFHLGDSSVCLDSICEDVETNAVFFLDGHWSAGITGKGDKDCPLFEELEVITRKFRNKAIVIIDDVRLFGKGPNKGNEVCDWEDINQEKVLDIVKNRLESHYSLDSSLAENDRLVLHLDPIS